MDSVYEAIGGMETFERLVHGFYSQVKEDNVIGPMYPDNEPRPLPHRYNRA